MVEDPADASGRQRRLRQESGGRAFVDQLAIVCFCSGGNQDHFGAALTVLGEEPGQVKTALLAEPDVDEDDVRAQCVGLPERLGDT